MSKIPDFEDYQDCIEYIDAIRPATNDVSNFRSFVEAARMPHVNQYRMRQATEQTVKGKNALAQKFNSDSLQNAVSIDCVVWINQPKLIGKIINELKYPIYTRLANRIAAYKSRNCDCSFTSTEADLTLYRQCCKQFRENLSDELTPPGFESLTNAPLNVILVNAGNIERVRDMFEKMVEMRAARLGNQINNDNQKEPAHYQKYRAAWMVFPNKIASIDLDARKKTGTLTGYSLVAGAVQAQANVRPLLLTTLLNIVEKEIESIETENRQQNGQRGAYQQVAGLDSFFSASFWLFRVWGITVETYPICSAGFYFIGKDGYGRDKTKASIQRMGGDISRKMLVSFSDSSNINLHPFVPTIPRMEELYTTFCNINVLDPECMEEGKTGCVRVWIHAINLRLNTDVFWQFIGDFFSMELAAEPDREVFQSLHILHQCLLSKKSAFQNTHGVLGNVYNVAIQQV